MKYIIKNCPNFIAEYSYFDACKCEKSSCINGVYQDCCKDISDCLLKRIVKKCELAKQGIGLSMKNFADEILEILEIEEVKDD